MDFGSGTGLPSFFLAEHLESVTLLDLSTGMIQQAQKKIDQLGVANIRALRGELTATRFAQPFDLVYTLMTLHHILNLEEILAALYQNTAPGGMLCIVDLETEDGSFHAEHPEFDGHLGFDQEELSHRLRNAGFSNVQHEPFGASQREEEDGTIRHYPLFLMIAKK